MKRYYTCSIVLGPKGYRPSLLNYVTPDTLAGESVHLVAPLQDQAGNFLNNFYFVLADLRDHAPLTGKPDVNPLPDVALDVKWGAIALNTRQAFKLTLPALGFTTTELSNLDNADGYREVVRAIIQKLQPVLTELSVEAQ